MLSLHIAFSHLEEQYSVAEDIRGYVGNEIIRKSSGSPGISYVFSDISHSVLIDNLGSTPIYFKFNSQVSTTNSGTGFIDKYTFRTFDVQCGSVFIQGSGTTTTPQVQVIRLT